MRLPHHFILVALACLALCASGRVARAQVSTEEAQRRLQEKLAAKHPASTQPVTEEERLRAENRRLRDRVAALEEEVTTLKVILSHANPTTAPATRPANAVAADNAGPQKALVGRWRGGDITNGSGYTLNFDADGTYKQSFIITGVKDSGQYRILDDGILEMWSDKTPEDRKHNQYHLAVTPLQATLTLAMREGIEVKNAQPLILKRAE